MNLQRLLDRRIFPLSSGEKQLIAIASVCTMEPKVIVMDEPSANLDSDAMVRLGSLLYRLKEAGHTIILSEHPLSIMSAIPLTAGIYGEWRDLLHLQPQRGAQPDRSAACGHGAAPLPAARFPGGWCVSLKAGGYPAGFENFLYAGRRQILEDVTFSSQSGKVLAIAGPNGAGKSTLCRIITGLYRSWERFKSMENI